MPLPLAAAVGSAGWFSSGRAAALALHTHAFASPACPLPCQPHPTYKQVQNSVLLDDVRTGPGCSIRGCVLGAGCVVGEGARLVDCQLAPGYAVPAGAELSEETLPPAAVRD